MKAIEKTKSSIVILFISILGFTSCRTTNNMSSIQVEMLKPALLALPEGVDTIAILNRDFDLSDTIPIKYINWVDQKVKIDSSIHFSYISNKCVDALANVLDTGGYYMKVINYRDSINYLFHGGSTINYPELHKKLGADILIILDNLKFKVRFSGKESGNTSFMSNIKDKFPEFNKSTKVERIDADLLWTVIIKGDTSIYVSKQPDNLFYGNSVYPEMFGNDINHKLLLTNTAEYLGKTFAKKIIPSWENVNRTYYRSNNTKMLQAEKLCINSEWIKAAEIYHRETNNKNRNIAAKATYNMALACEMEGKYDAAIDWLVRSYSAYKKVNQTHQSNCKQYLELIVKRKKEIELLEKQIRM